MQITLRFGEIILRVYSERKLHMEPILEPFTWDGPETADVKISVSWDWIHAPKPTTDRVGEDLLCYYYREVDHCFQETRGGPKGPVACSVYTPACNEILCTINEKPFLEPPNSLGSILRMIPIRAIFQKFGTIFLHASQISYQGKGILFTAPSGTGKTTQAKLWRDHRGAQIICNDRTLLRKRDGLWRTYGYPLDGAEPVRSTQVGNLGAVVLLSQGQEECLVRPNIGKACAMLMEQTVMDCWNPEARTRAMELLLELLEDIPVYHLTCRPDVQAVEVLEKKLMEDGVLSYG